MTVEILDNLSLYELAQVLELFKRIKGRTCTAANFLKWMTMVWADICLTVIRDKEKIVGFTLATAPCLLEPKIGRLPFSSVLPGVPGKNTQEALRLAEDWLKEQGATMYRFESVRTPRALERIYGMVPSNEVLYEKQLK